MIRIALAVCLAAGVVSGCAGQRLLPSPPAAVYQDVRVPGYPQEIRVWGDTTPENIGDQIQTINDQITARVEKDGKLPNGGRFDVLVLSGGGTDGAFGAGVLNAWTDHGGRPEFGLVTGISTGALIAPYAFLGSKYDRDIELSYTNIATDDVLDLAIFSALRGDRLGVSDPAKLQAIVARALTPEFVAEIAAEHAKGRRLWIGTTNLDSQRPVTWDIGAIASSGNPGAPRLIRDILVASASIPVAFPPVQFQVVHDGQAYSEMHADGGVTRQLFLYPSELRLAEREENRDGLMRFGTIYVIRNAKLAPEYGEVTPDLGAIARRSMSTLLKAAGVADVGVIQAQAARDGWGLQLTAVPESFEGVEEEPFDPEYMRALYDIGYTLASKGDAWRVAVETPE
ncbi:MAG: patatin-like phospholipase family protein [Pseudomonadota bacterium]